MRVLLLALVGCAVGGGVHPQARAEDGVVIQSLRVEGTIPKADDPIFKIGNPYAKDFIPDVMVIILGTNDTKPQNWAKKDEFVADYQDMIAQFAALPSKPRIFICYPPYIAGNGNFGIGEANTKAEFPMIDAVAKATKAVVIDVHGSLVGKDALIPDKVHPNTEGAGEIAKAVYQGLTGKAASAK